MQQFREPRSYTYDDQGNSYSTGHASHHSSEYSLTTPAYPQYDSSAFYSSTSMGGANDSHTSPYYRSMTPSLSHTRYPSASRDSRGYFSGDGTLPSPTSSSGVYTSNGAYFAGSFGTSPEPRTQFIPTPSEMANAYSNYAPMIPRSPTVPPPDRYSTGSVSYPAHLMSSTHGGPLRPRISTTRPRSGTLGSSPATSPSGERFPCEKCGKTFSRSHDRKRHHETQHLATPIIHRCRWCEKEFSRWAIQFFVTS
nr:zinc finger domain-containing protein [Coprinopsis cinerea]